MNVASSVEQGRRQHPERPALIFENAAISYRRLDRLADREAARLRSIGIARGDRVALCLPNTPQFAASYFGALKLGAIVVSINPGLTDAEIRYILNDCGARHVVRDPDNWRKDGDEFPEVAALDMACEDPAVIVYTSGTTGFPKGATLSHGNVVFTMESKRRYLGIQPDDMLMLFLPLFHCFGQNAILNAGLCSGATLVLHRAFDKDRILDSVTRDRITMLCAVPANFIVLFDAATPDQMRGIRYYMSAAAPLPLELETRWQAKFGRPIHQGYGLTETSPFASYNHLAAYRPGSIGSPIDGVQMAIVDFEGRNILPPGVAGEIVVKGPNIMLGYWNRPEETLEAIRDGWFHTGDIGRVSDDGYFFIEDRLKDMAIVGGYNVYPAEVENALYRHPAVAEAAAYGVPDPVLGERMRATVTLKPGATPAAGELIAFCRGAIAEYKLPAEIEFADAIPRSRSGKVLKRVLRDAYRTAQSKPLAPSTAVMDAAGLERRIVAWIADALALDIRDIHPNQPFAEFGFTSLAAVELASELGAWLGQAVAPTITWQYSTPHLLAQGLAAHAKPNSAPAPTAESSGLAEEIALLSEEEAEALLLAELDSLSQVKDRDRAPAPQPVATPPPLVPVTLRYPLSYGQEALWFIHESDPETPAYNVGIALRVLGKLDPEALRRALRTLGSRHPMLRATFSAPAGQPEQEIHEDCGIHLTRTDAAAWSPAELKRQVAESHRSPFQLSTGPVLRAELFTRSAQDHVLLLSMHHIACDGLSFWTMIEELQAAYSGKSLPPVRETYVEYLRWQREMLDGPEGEELWNFWRQQLEGDLPALNLPTDLPRPSVQTFRGAARPLVIGPDLTRRLRELARAQAATLHNTLLAAYAAMLGRYAGQSEVIIGCATSGRPREFNGVVGYFTNPIPIRADLTGDPDFASLLAQIRRKTFEGIERQQMPFAVLVKRLQPKRDPSRSPIFQADFSLLKRPPAYRNEARNGNGAVGFPLQPFELAEEEGQFDIGLHISENDDDLTGVFKYNTSLFLPETIETMAACYLTLLEAAAAGPTRSLSALPLVSPEMRRRLLFDANQTAVSYPEVPVQRLFERQAFLTPDAIAAEMFGTSETYTYAELNLRANQLAHRLRELGVGPEILIGVGLGRSLDLVTAILAVLKAGGAYVPLDPSYPAQRLEFMMRDAGMTVLLTTGELAARLAVPAGIAVIRVDEERASIAARDTANPAVDTTPVNLAYVIYTSGSTGLPKGTLIEHRGLTNYLSWCVEAYRAAEGLGAPVSSPMGFDATITSFFAPLIAGGRVVMLPEDSAIESLAECLRTYRGFSLIKITPAHLEILSQMLKPEECAGRAQAFVIGGEALRADMLKFWRKHAPATRLINEYGPTETVVGCCVYQADGDLAAAVPIGRPIANTELYVLDSNMEPVPPGVVGELYIGGAGVARGYLNRPELTEARFVADPFSGRPAARLFRTGDLARLLPDGNLDFLGRIDNQVKIRGYRIELGEIESVLALHPRVQEAAVAVANGRLAAYFTPRGEAPDAAGILGYLANRLPAYMVPAFVIALDQFPLTPNGKIDRAALPAPEASRAASSFVAPRESLELKIAAVWEQVLGVRPVGVKDNFFDLGGHSLLAVQLAARLEKETGQRVPLTTILRGPTVEQLAAVLRKDARPRIFSPLVPIQPSGGKPPFYCVPGAGGNVIYLYNLARHLGSDRPFYGLQGVGFEGEAPPQRSVQEMAAHYLHWVEGVQPRGPYFLGGHSLGGWVAYEIAQQLARRGQEVGLVAIIDTPTPTSAAVRDTSGWSNARWIVELAGRIGQLLNPDLEISLDALGALDGPAQIEYFRAALIKARLFPEEAGIAQIHNVLEMFKAHTQVSYRIPDRPLPVRIALLRTHAEPPGRPADGDVSWGWSAIASTEVHFVPGEHLTALRTPHVQDLASRLSLCLDHAQQAVAQSPGRAAACPL